MMHNDVSSGLTTPAGAVVRKHVYTVVERNDRSYWTKVGIAFVNRDGSLTLRLDAIPVNGMLQVRDEDYSARRANGGAQ